ncbi:DUF86 domain-containing protein [Methanoculleus sp. FWC-SCC1]|uniref:DUF86 domain-containing protein n=1 Tax=Methanoculleus frigidifontis TaxID=2584085 RepID=A0ABT8MC48_9EURY|nr:DUF86 domain-containing protein [Methanoculleus sp. FWC-SCC1]MDN7025445.1 DUF86 domain-containing protein [Methanoculleus sp. FWC-SCC1]
MTPKDPVYLRHILDAIENIEEFSKDISSAADLTNHRLERAAIERMLTIIGEAAKNISVQMRRKHPEIPWKEAAGMRDKISHHYFGVDYEAVFLTIKDDLPALKRAIRAVLDEADR